MQKRKKDKADGVTNPSSPSALQSPAPEPAPPHNVRCTSDRVWGWIGKCGVLVAIVWGVIQIVGSCTSDFDLRASGEYASFALPDTLLKELDAIDCYALQAAARKLLTPPECTSAPASTSADVAGVLDPSLISEKLGGWLKDRFPRTLRDVLSESKGVVWIDVENEGRKEVTSLDLQLSNKGWYLLRRQGLEDQFGSFSSIVPLGSLKPGARLSITLWTRYGGFMEFDEDRTRLVHANGTSAIAFRRQVGGIWGWMANHSIFMSTFVLPMTLCLLGLWLYHAVRRARRARG